MNVFDALRVFSDPATPFKVAQSDGAALVEMVRDGDELRFMINADGSIISRNGDKKKYQNAKALIASKEFADLRGLAQTQLRIDSDLSNVVIVDQELVMLRGAEPFSSGDGLEVLQGALAERSAPGKAKVVLVDGPAGVGKSFLLRRLVHSAAKGFCENFSGIVPVLYVASRGRRLSDLSTSFAMATQQVRASFTFDQIPVLVNLGLISVAIDGFDELVDADGYKDAWSALKDFFRQLHGAGSCILAGRDTFFDQQGFVERVAGSGIDFDFYQASFRNVASAAGAAYLLKHGFSQQEIDQPFFKRMLEEGAYTLRPVFLHTVTNQRSEGLVATAQSFRGQLIASFIAREAGILRRGIFDSEPAVDVEAELYEVFQEIAADMSSRESDEVDPEFVAFVCEVRLSGRIPPQSLDKLKFKAGSIGFLQQGRPGFLEFPHAEIRNYFLAQHIFSELKERNVPLALQRSVLGTDFLETSLDVLEDEREEGMYVPAFEYLKTIIEVEGSATRLRSNACTLYLVSLSCSDFDIGEYKYLHADEAMVRGVARPASIIGADFGIFDLCGADISSVVFDGVSVSKAVVDEKTVFGVSRPQISCLNVAGQSVRRALRDPREISDWLNAHSRSEERRDNGGETEYTSYFQKVCRKAHRQFYMREDEESPIGAMLSSPYWPIIRDILVKHERIDFEENKQTGGNPQRLVHIRNARGLLFPEGGDASARAIWDEVRALR